MDRNEAIRRIRAALKRRTGKQWSVTGDRGTAWGWINVDVPPRQRTWHHVETGERDEQGLPVYSDVNDPAKPGGHMSPEAQKQLQELFGLERPVHHQGLSIDPESRDWHVEQAEKGEDAAEPEAKPMVMAGAQRFTKPTDTAIAGKIEPAPDTPEARKLLLLPANLGPLAKLSARVEHARFTATTAVRLVSTVRGYRAEATDGRVLGMVTGPLPEKPEDYPSIAALEAAPGGEAVALLPAADWDKAFRALPKQRTRYAKPILGNLAAALGKNDAVLASTDLDRASVANVRQVDGRYPDVDNVLPKKKPRLTFLVDPELLIRLLTVAKSFTDDEHKAVTFEVRDDGAPIAVKCGVSGQKFTGLIVPLSRGK